jgi:hypothetical protein
MSIKTIKTYKQFPIGTTLNLDDDAEEQLVRAGLAVTTTIHSFSVWPNFVRTATNTAGDVTPALAGTITIPKGVMGPNSGLRISFWGEANTAVATNKQINIKIGGISLGSPSSNSSTLRSFGGQLVMLNVGATNSQRTNNSGFLWTTQSSNTPISTAIDTSQAFNITFELLWSAAVATTETLTFLGASIEVI